MKKLIMLWFLVSIPFQSAFADIDGVVVNQSRTVLGGSVSGLEVKVKTLKDPENKIVCYVVYTENNTGFGINDVPPAPNISCVKK